jgi:hypothetical protein
MSAYMMTRSGHGLPGTGRRAHVSDGDHAAGVRGSDQCLDGFAVQRRPEAPGAEMIFR